MVDVWDLFRVHFFLDQTLFKNHDKLECSIILFEQCKSHHHLDCNSIIISTLLFLIRYLNRAIRLWSLPRSISIFLSVLKGRFNFEINLIEAVSKRLSRYLIPKLASSDRRFLQSIYITIVQNNFDYLYSSKVKIILYYSNINRLQKAPV